MQKCVTQSKEALEKLQDDLELEDFELTIEEAFSPLPDLSFELLYHHFFHFGALFFSHSKRSLLPRDSGIREFIRFQKQACDRSRFLIISSTCSLLNFKRILPFLHHFSYSQNQLSKLRIESLLEWLGFQPKNLLQFLFQVRPEILDLPK